MLDIRVLNRHGRSWLHRFNPSSQKDRMSAVLGIDL